MKATIKITCKACGCSMELETTKWKRSDSLICQSCGQRMDSRSIFVLNEALQAIQDVPDQTSADGEWFPQDQGFYLEFTSSDEK